jgi:CheY-like chemotaxis protein
MERQLKQMVRLVDDLLDVSRINTGKLTIRREPVELRAVVTNALEIARPFIDAQGHALAVELPAQPVYVLGDATRLAQVLSNLLNNAARYTPRGGHIKLDAHAAADGRLKIRVADDGIGIAPQMLGEIFEMFVQADASLERSNAGLGVGLSLARRLVELHDGAIEAFSDGPGKGSAFVVTLPALQTAGASAARTLPAAGAGKPHRILLVDDNVDFVNAIGALLRTLGHTVQVCHDGPQALAAAAAFTPADAPDFAFLDIGLPGLNGYDLARALRQMPALARTVMVAVTGWGQQKDRDLAFEAGFEEHLVKPVSVEQILAILAGHREGVAVADRG